MELKRCKNGHSYDPSITPECPECASLAGHTVPLGGGANYAPQGMGHTIPLDNSGWGAPDNYGKTQPIVGDTVAVNPQQPSSWADQSNYETAGYAQDTYGVTLPVGAATAEMAIRPVTGWLVCVRGPEKGKDYRLHADMNYIGRSRGNDVVLASDPTVSRDRHAMVAYDNRDRIFYFAPANGSSLVRKNGRPVLSTVDLKLGDELEIGEGIYRFVPLCGEDFEW